MDSPSFELKLKQSKIYAPRFWSNLVNKFSKINDLGERLIFIRKLKNDLEQETIWLVASQRLSLHLSSTFVINAMKALEEEELAIIKVMSSPQETIMTQVEGCRNEGNPKRNYISHGHLDKIPTALNQHQEHWVTVNPNKRKWASVAPTVARSFKTQLISPGSLPPESTNLSSPAGHMNQDPSSFGPTAAPQLQPTSSQNILAECDQNAAEQNLRIRVCSAKGLWP